MNLCALLVEVEPNIAILSIPGNTQLAAVEADLAEKAETDMPLIVCLLEEAAVDTAAMVEIAPVNVAVEAAVSSGTDRVVYMQTILTSPAAVVVCLRTEIRASVDVAARAETLALELGMETPPLDLVA